jgi:hypothetical protein
VFGCKPRAQVSGVLACNDHGHRAVLGAVVGCRAEEQALDGSLVVAADRQAEHLRQ